MKSSSRIKRSGARAIRVALTGVALAAPPSLASAGVTPANDDCADAFDIGLGDTPFTNVGATVEPPGVCAQFGRDVWFRFESTFNGVLRVRTCSDADFDTVIAVYSGCGCGSFTLLGCNDDATNCVDGRSRLDVTVQAGECYRIRLGGFQAQEGIGVLTLSVPNGENAASANRIKTGFEPGDRFGFSVSGAARFDIDDNDDILIGGPKNDMLGADTGRGYSYEGPDLGEVATLTGAAAYDNFGYSVATGCDVNDDGRDDLIIGAPFNDEAGALAGKVFVYSGFDNSLLWSRTGAAASDRFGWAVRCAGDIDADGFADVVVGAPYHDTGGTDTGRAYVLDGQNGDILRTVTGQTDGELFGSSVTSVGDMNNDGKDDFAVGAPLNDNPNGTNAGRASIFSGAGGVIKRYNGDNAGDRFGTSVAGLRFTSTQNYSMLAVGAPYNDAGGSNAGRVKVYYRNISNPSSMNCSSFLCLLYTINGGNAGDRFGTSVEVANLVGSTFADIAIGSPFADLNGSSSGVVHVFNGSNGTLAKRFFGEANNDKFGSAIALAGDVNGGGFNDLLVGSPYNDAGGVDAGRAYVFFLDSGNQPQAATANPDPPPGAPEKTITAAGDPSLKIEADPAADLNQDGVVNADDLTVVLSQWGACLLKSAPATDGENTGTSGCAADLDDSGTVDHADLQAVIDAWMAQ
jgi:hypothetical protein